MGLLDFFRKNAPQTEAPARPADKKGYVDKKVASLSRTASNKRAQAYDRDEALRRLIDIGTVEAADALLQRFTPKVDPSITDLEEKQLAFDGIVTIGRGQKGKRLADVGKDPKEVSDAPLTEAELGEISAAVIDRTVSYCRSAENLTWALKVLRALEDDERYERTLLALLGDFDTEYTRNVEPKVNLLAALEEVVSPRVRAAVEAYLDDANETVRFHAVETTYKQGSEASIAPLCALLAKEESVRVKNKVAEGMIRLGWKLPEALREQARTAMSDVWEYRLRDDGSFCKA
jgi:hypothetical protein